MDYDKCSNNPIGCKKNNEKQRKQAKNKQQNGSPSPTYQ